MPGWLQGALLAAIEYLYLVLLWMAFVSKADKTEFVVGLIVALIGTIADALVKAKGLGHFHPRLRWLLLIFLEPWYILKGMWAVIEYFPHAVRTHTDGHLKAVAFTDTKDRVESATRRSLATMLLTIPPNSLVLGIDARTLAVLVHEMKPEGPSLLSRELGIKE